MQSGVTYTLNPHSCAMVMGQMILLESLYIKPSTLKQWTLSMHTCSELVQDVADMTDGSTQSEVMIHKETHHTFALIHKTGKTSLTN